MAVPGETGQMVGVELLHSGSREAPRGVERFKELVAEWRSSLTGNGKHREQHPAAGADRCRNTPSQRSTNTLKCRQEVQTEVGSRNILRYLNQIIDALILIAAWFRFGRSLTNVPLAHKRSAHCRWFWTETGKSECANVEMETLLLKKM